MKLTPHTPAALRPPLLGSSIISLDGELHNRPSVSFDGNLIPMMSCIISGYNIITPVSWKSCEVDGGGQIVTVYRGSV